MENKIEYCFVVDKDNQPLAPTKANKGWYLIRKGKARLKSKYPMVIQLEKRIKLDENDKSYMVCGIDDGSNGGETANKRIEWDIEKSHSNDAICIADSIPDSCNIKEWTIKPMRRKSKAKTDNVLGIKHRDLISYTYKNGETHTGYVTALYPEQLALNFQSKTKHCKKVNARKCKLLWQFNKIYWLE